jgi:hypothetical protein
MLIMSLSDPERPKCRLSRSAVIQFDDADQLDRKELFMTRTGTPPLPRQMTTCTIMSDRDIETTRNPKPNWESDVLVTPASVSSSLYDSLTPSWRDVWTIRTRWVGEDLHDADPPCRASTPCIDPYSLFSHQTRHCIRRQDRPV